MTETEAKATRHPDDRLDSVLVDLTRIKDEVVRTKEWYRTHGQRPMLLFRAFGVAIILLSISVPFLGTLQGVWREVVLPIATLLIAALTGLNSFFQWQTQWQGFRQTQFALEHLLQKWEIEIIWAKNYPEVDKRVEMAMAATSELLDRAREATSNETRGFFEGMQLPSAG